MSDDDWDSENFTVPVVPGVPPVGGGDRWSGEDEDSTKDNWDEEETSTTPGAVGVPAQQTKKKKPLAVRIAEREARKKQELEEKIKQEAEKNKEMSAAERQALKLQQQRLEEESDLRLAKEAFGLNDLPSTGIDAMNPNTKEEFDEFEKSLRDKITRYEKSPHYVNFLEALLRDVTIAMDGEDIRRLSSSLNALANEKVKVTKAKSKKKRGKATLHLDREEDNVNDMELYEDFM